MKYVITRQLVIDFVDDKIFVITPTSQTSYDLLQNQRICSDDISEKEIVYIHFFKNKIPIGFGMLFRGKKV